MEPTREDLLAAASGFNPEVKKALTAGELIKPKRFEYDFSSPGWPEYDGKVVIRYPSLGDMLSVESMSGGKGAHWEMWAAFTVCIEKAPGAWYSLPKGAELPSLALSAIQDSEGLWDMWVAYLEWRRSFRRKRE